MPKEFNLEQGADVTYHLIFEVPAAITDEYKLIYQEIDTNGVPLTTLTIDFDSQGAVAANSSESSEDSSEE